MKGYKQFLNEEKNYKDPINDKKFINDLMKLIKKMGMEDIELDGNDLFFHNPTHMDTGSIGKMKSADKIEKLIQKHGYDDDEFTIRSSVIEIPSEYVAEGTYYVGGMSYTKNADRMSVYNDMKPEQRKKLDDYCNVKFGKPFLYCSFENQSTARSYLWTTKNDPNEIKDQIEKNKKF